MNCQYCRTYHAENRCPSCGAPSTHHEYNRSVFPEVLYVTEDGVVPSGKTSVEFLFDKDFSGSVNGSKQDGRAIFRLDSHPDKPMKEIPFKVERGNAILTMS